MSNDEAIDDLIETLRGFDDQVVTSRRNTWGRALAAIRAMRGEMASLRSFARDLRDNHDCDPDAHRHGTPCYVCEAGRLLARIEGITEEHDTP